MQIMKKIYPCKYYFILILRFLYLVVTQLLFCVLNESWLHALVVAE